ncbi:MAG: D-aminoacylase, partial [Patescibacteria group bacterium]
MATYDTIIKSGMLYDGKGGDPVQADIGIVKDRIAAIGQLTDKTAKVINALGKYVTPGFIDITNHSDTHLTIFKYPGLESMLMQGITTAIGGNCG